MTLDFNMVIDLNPLPYRTAIHIIKWCAERDIDREKCLDLLEAMSIINPEPVTWELNIPDKYITFFLMSWPMQADSYD